MAQWLNGDHLDLDVILGPKPANSEAPAMNLEAERREPNDLEAMPTHGEDGRPTNPDDPAGNIVTI